MSVDHRRLSDRNEISDTVIAYATGIDMLRWQHFRSVFTERLEVDFSSFSGRPPSTEDRDDWIRGVVSLQEGFDATQHISSNHVIEFHRPDEATCVSYMQATHYLRPETWVLGGYYTNTLTRHDGAWRIRRCQLTVTWEQGDRALAARARERVANGQGRTPSEPMS